MPDPPRSWPQKFADAFRGVAQGISGQRSFFVHLPVACAVVATGFVLQVSRIEWCLLALSIVAVVGAELFNSSIESLAEAIDREHNPLLGRALDIASGAVLVISAGSAAVGLAIFVPRLLAVGG